jgi:rhodanese-related sulfurtransferase
MNSTNNISAQATSEVHDTSKSINSAVANSHPHEVQKWLGSGDAILVDVREADEHARERIQGAQLAPLSTFNPNQVRAMVKPGQRLVMHCKSGRRASDAARMMAEFASAGLAISSMTGGIEGWKAEKFPVVLNKTVSKISVMRQVQIVIGLGVLVGAALAWFVHPAFIAIPAFFGAGLTFAGVSGTCALASIIGKMPWNKFTSGADSCGI